MNGKRVYKKAPHELEPGDYGVYEETGDWYAMTPNGLHANLSAHEVTEHEDGTVTVSPSIGISTTGEGGFQWHGFLKRGVWEPC